MARSTALLMLNQNIYILDILNVVRDVSSGAMQTSGQNNIPSPITSSVVY